MGMHVKKDPTPPSVPPSISTGSHGNTFRRFARLLSLLVPPQRLVDPIVDDILLTEPPDSSTPSCDTDIFNRPTQASSNSNGVRSPQDSNLESDSDERDVPLPV